jgi:hypothetical protein
VKGLDHLVETVRQPGLRREAAVPLAVVTDDAAHLPLRQVEFKQRQRRIGPGAPRDQLLQASRPVHLDQRQSPRAGVGDHIGKQAHIGRSRALDAVRQLLTLALMFPGRKHDAHRAGRWCCWTTSAAWRGPS